VPGDGTDPAQSRRVAVLYGDERGITVDGRQQFHQMGFGTLFPPVLEKPVRRRYRQQPKPGLPTAEVLMRGLRFAGDGAGIDNRAFRVGFRFNPPIGPGENIVF